MSFLTVHILILVLVLSLGFMLRICFEAQLRLEASSRLAGSFSCHRGKLSIYAWFYVFFSDPKDRLADINLIVFRNILIRLVVRIRK